MKSKKSGVIETLPAIGPVNLEWGVRLQLVMMNALIRLGVWQVDKIAAQPLAKRRLPPPAWMTLPPVASAAIGEREIPSRGGTLKLRLYAPAATDPAQPILLFLHGGGFIQGSPQTFDHLCSRIAVDARMTVASLQYRLAPEFPFPAAVEDACDAAEWLVENHATVAPSSGVAMMGESAGANLTAATCLVLRKQGGPSLVHQTLLYPLTDCTLQLPSHDYRKGGLTKEMLQDMTRIYLNGADPCDPRASPLLEPDLSGLPPALIVSSEGDPLRDDSHQYAKRLASAGTPVQYVNVLDTIHGFFATPRLSKEGRGAIDLVVEAMRGLGHAP